MPPDQQPLVGQAKEAGRIDVLQVITTATRRGAEVFAVGLHEQFSAHGLRVETVALVGGAVPALDVDILGHRRLGIKTLARLRRRISRAAVVIAHGSTALPATVLASLGLDRAPFIYRNIGDPAYWATSRLKRARTSLLLRPAAGVVALTDETRSRLLQLYHLKAERVVTIPSAIDPAAFPRRTQSDRMRARHLLGYPDDIRLAVCVGALSPEKAVTDAVRAMAELPDRWHLAVAGDGPEALRVHNAAAEIGGGRVRLLGQVDDVAMVMTAADLLVLPSLTEGVPGVLIEAASIGVPAVATAVGFVTEVIDDGVSGVIVPPGSPSALAEGVLRCESFIDRMGDAAAANAQTYSLAAVAERWLALITPLLSDDRGAR